jgi:pilus assembly protein Flp/PilA
MPSLNLTKRCVHIMQRRESAQGLVEYGLIIALVAVLAIAGLIIFGPAVSSLLSSVGGSV